MAFVCRVIKWLTYLLTYLILKMGHVFRDPGLFTHNCNVGMTTGINELCLCMYELPYFWP